MTAAPTMWPAPTLTPTSTWPTWSPAKMTPMPTQKMTSSMAPTTCYWIDFVVVYDWAPVQSSLKLQRTNDFGDSSQLDCLFVYRVHLLASRRV